MRGRKVAFSLAMLTLFAFLLPQSAQAKFEGYAYFDTQNITEFSIFPDQQRYKLGDTMNLKYAITRSYKDLKGAKIEIYSVNGVLADNNYSANMAPTNDFTGKIKLLKTIELPTITKDKFYSGETSIVLSVDNGFKISKIDPAQPLTYAINRDQRNFLLVKFSDPNKAMVDYDYLSWNESYFNRSIVFFVDAANKSYPDLTIQNVKVSKNILKKVSDSFSVTYDVKNIGLSASTESTQVCFTKRNIILDKLNGILDIYDSQNKMICDTIKPLASQSSETHTINYNPAQHKFGTHFSDQVSINDQLTLGNNRLVLVLNPYSYLAESNYDNNEYVFNLSVGNIQPESIVTPQISPITAPVVTSPAINQNNSQISEGSILKSPLHPGVYYYEGGKRRPFINAAVYYTWFSNFNNVKNISVEQMEAISLGTPMPIQAGTKLLKFPLNPRVYEVTSGNRITHIANEEVAIQKFGKGWAQSVIELPEIYYLFYEEIK